MNKYALVMCFQGKLSNINISFVCYIEVHMIRQLSEKNIYFNHIYT